MNGETPSPELTQQAELPLTPNERIEHVSQQMRELIDEDPVAAIVAISSIEVLNQLRRHPVNLYEPDPNYPYANPPLLRRRILGKDFRLADPEASSQQKVLMSEAVRKKFGKK